MPRRKKGEDGEKEFPRNAANARERTRMRVLSKAFGRLKLTLPWVPPDTKLSKLDTLRLAMSYIGHLKRTLEQPEDIDGSTQTTKGWPYSVTTSGSNSSSSEPSFSKPGLRSLVTDEPLHCSGSRSRSPVDNGQIYRGSPVDNGHIYRRSPVDDGHIYRRSQVDNGHIYRGNSVDNDQLYRRSPLNSNQPYHGSSPGNSNQCYRGSPGHCDQYYRGSPDLGGRDEQTAEEMELSRQEGYISSSTMKTSSVEDDIQEAGPCRQAVLPSPVSSRGCSGGCGFNHEGGCPQVHEIDGQEDGDVYAPQIPFHSVEKGIHLDLINSNQYIQYMRNSV